MMTICLYGGSFDPIHKGHIHFAERIIDAYHPDAFYFVPAYYSPFKANIKHTTDEHRLNMLEIAIRHIPKTHISTLEIDRKGLSYTLDTLKAFHALYPGHRLYWIIGDDHLKTLDQWKGYPDHFMYCDFIVLPRQNDAVEDDMKDHPYKDQIHFLDAGIVPVSSSAIRNAVAGGHSILPYVLPEINDYISANKLYR